MRMQPLHHLPRSDHPPKYPYRGTRDSPSRQAPPQRYHYLCTRPRSLRPALPRLASRFLVFDPRCWSTCHYQLPYIRRCKATVTTIGHVSPSNTHLITGARDYPHPLGSRCRKGVFRHDASTESHCRAVIGNITNMLIHKVDRG